MWDSSVLLRLFLAIVLGGFIGFEREAEGKPAGIRTHALVCLGATLFMLISIKSPDFFPGAGTVDPGRIAAQVVTGVGFLGAGTIMRSGGAVKGLTTAASIWTVAAIGLAVGVGYYVTAIVSTALALAVLHLPEVLSKRARLGAGVVTLRVVSKTGPERLPLIDSVMTHRRAKTVSISVVKRGTEMDISYSVAVRAAEIQPLVGDITGVEGVHSVSVEL